MRKLRRRVFMIVISLMFIMSFANAAIQSDEIGGIYKRDVSSLGNDYAYAYTDSISRQERCKVTIAFKCTNGTDDHTATDDDTTYGSIMAETADMSACSGCHGKLASSSHRVDRYDGTYWSDTNTAYFTNGSFN